MVIVRRRGWIEGRLGASTPSSNRTGQSDGPIGRGIAGNGHDSRGVAKIDPDRGLARRPVRRSIAAGWWWDGRGPKRRRPAGWKYLTALLTWLDPDPTCGQSKRATIYGISGPSGPGDAARPAFDVWYERTRKISSRPPVSGEGGHQCFWRHGRCSRPGSGGTCRAIVLTAGTSIDIPVPQEWSPYRMQTTAYALARWHETDPRRCRWTETIPGLFKRSTDR
jgi:hypothetical protein